MGLIERRWTLKVCRECGSNVHTDECRYTGALTNAPSDEVEVAPADALRELLDAGEAAHSLAFGTTAQADRWRAAKTAARAIVGGQ
jgi:hypothetical protein